MNGPLRYLGAGAALLAPALLLVSDVLLVQFISEPGLLVQRVALTLFVPAIVGVTLLAQSRARTQLTAGAALAIVGAAWIVIRQSWLAAPMRFPAVLLPIGLLVMAGGMIGATVSRRVAALLALGALLFPLGHQTGFAVILLLSDALLIAAFWSVALQMLTTQATEARRHGA